LDQPQRQVLIQVLLAEVTLDGNSDQGIDWAVSRDFIPDASFPNDESGNDFSAGSSFGSDSGSALGGLTATITNGDVDFILRAMQSDGKLEILSRPQILAADNQPATIDIGQRVPFVTGSSFNERGNLVNSFSYEQVGVQLNVTPRISPDGLVKLDVEPTISSLSTSSVPISEGFDAPVINNRSASTMVSVQDGQTVVMGGLISTQDNVRETKIPLLGDIPYLGVAFKRTKKIRSRTELLIIMTPQVIETPEEIEKFSRESIENSTFMRPFDESGTKRNETQIRILDSIDPKARKEKGVTVPKSSPSKLRDKI
jgi:type II secretory pathway component GspD/PulD (secretin)